MFNKLYSHPSARLVRRFVVVGLAASFAYLGTKVPMDDPLSFVDAILGFSQADWFDLGKVFIGAGVLAGLDKLRREWKNLWL